jgi:hypothetical protein
MPSILPSIAHNIRAGFIAGAAQLQNLGRAAVAETVRVRFSRS